MNSTKWTPGPWHIVSAGTCQGGERRRVQVKGSNGGGAMMIDYEPCSEGEATARLIAAAPELYEALEEMMRQFEPADPGNDDGVSDCDAIVLARAALARARGDE